MKKIKIIIQILISVSIIGCQQDDSKIKEFKSKVPTEDLRILNNGVEVLEKIIERNYPKKNKNDGFIQVLNDILDGRTKGWNYDINFFCNYLEDLEKSTLKYKSENIAFDTVYQEENSGQIISVTPAQDTSWELVVAPLGSSAVEHVKKRGFWQFKSESTFVKGIESIMYGNKELKEYVDKKKSVGEINYKRMIEHILKDKSIDLDDFFMKRIIVFEVLTNHLKNGQSCE